MAGLQVLKKIRAWILPWILHQKFVKKKGS
jgi:hypothetical protein